jgi:hypothetical protein
MARPCKNPSCNGALIHWVDVTRNGIDAGYYADDSTGNRHLCPGWKDPRSSEEREIANTRPLSKHDFDSAMHSIERSIRELHVMVSSLCDRKVYT